MENKGRSNCSLVLHIKDTLNRYLLKSLESYLTSSLISHLYLFSQSFRFSFHGDPLICPIQGIQCHCLSSGPEQLQQFHLPPCLQPLPSLVSLSWRYLNQILYPWLLYTAAQVFQCQITSCRGKTKTLVWYSVSSIIYLQLLGDGKWTSPGSWGAEVHFGSVISCVTQERHLISLWDAVSSCTMQEVRAR